MLGILKRFLSRSDATVATAQPPPLKPSPVVVSPPRPSTGVRPATRPSGLASRQSNSLGSTGTAPHAHPERQIPGEVQILLSCVEAALPEALRHKVAGAVNDTISIPAEYLVPQLSLGAVVLSMGDLRNCAPEVLSSLAGHDDIPVPLPLSEVLRQLDTAHYALREGQKKINIPEEVSSVFANGITGGPAAPTKPATASVPTTTSRPRASTSRTAAISTNSPTPEAAPPPTKIAMSPQAMAALQGATAKPSARTNPATTAKPVNNAATAAAKKVSAPAKVIRSSASTTSAPSRPVAADSPRSRPAPANQAAKTQGESLPVPMQKLGDVWPDEIRRELSDVDTTTAHLHIPMEILEPALKAGKVHFAWSELAEWMQPPLQFHPSKSTADMIVDLPLKILAPIFMAHHRSGGGQKKTDVDESIPNLFQSGTGPGSGNSALQAKIAAPNLPPPPQRAVTQTASQSPAPPLPMPGLAEAPSTPTPLPKPGSPSVRDKNTVTLEQIIGPDGRRYAPKEILQNAAKLPGLTGSLLAMSDGLLVASTLAPTAKPDTVAAFLPQMFGRMGQYTKELGLGQLNSLSLSVEGACWQVFKQPNIYFAVSGKPGEPTPFNLLAQIAAELSRQQM